LRTFRAKTACIRLTTALIYQRIFRAGRALQAHVDGIESAKSSGGHPFLNLSGDRNEKRTGHTALHRARPWPRGLQSRESDHVDDDPPGRDAVTVDIVVVDNAAHVAERFDVVELVGDPRYLVVVQRHRLVVELGHAARVFGQQLVVEHAEFRRHVDGTERQQQGQVTILRGVDRLRRSQDSARGYA